MTSKQRLECVLNGQIPDVPPHWELVFQIEKEMFGMDPAAVAEADRGVFQVDVFHRLIDELGWAAVGGHWEAAQIDRCQKALGHKALVAAFEGEGVFWMPTGGDMMDFVVRLFEQPEELHREARRKCDTAKQYFRQAVDVGADFFVLTYDFGYNDAPFVSPEQFKDIVTPYLAELVQSIHDLGKKAILHSDGCLNRVLDQIHGTGVDGYQSIDPQGHMDIKQVRERFPDWILMGNVACNMLQDTNEAQIRESVRYCMTHGGIGKPYIFSTSNCIFNGMPPESYRIMLDEYRRLCEGKTPTDGEFLVSVFNPSPFPRKGVMLDVEFPDACPEDFTMALRDGTPVPYQRVSARQRMQILRPYRDIPGGSFRSVQTVFADVTVPALGYTTVVYKSGSAETIAAGNGRGGTRPSRTVDDGLCTVLEGAVPSAPKSMCALANGLISLSFTPDGTITLTDLATGEKYPGLNAFEDGGDTGDGWKYIPPANDRIATGLSEVSVTVTASGPFVASAVVNGTLTVPAGLTPDQKGRSAVTARVRLCSTFTIRRGSRRVDVRTEIENTARDHVIKALFPARAASWESFADSMFDVVRRDIRPPAGVVFEEPWQENRPLESFVGISDRRRGLVVFAKGVHEGGVRNNEARSVFLTLLRCYSRTVLTLGEEGGQMLGRQTMEYAFMSIRDHELPAVLAEREQFLHPVRCSHSLDVLLNRKEFTGTLDDTRSFLSISDPRVVLSALRRNPRGDLILRVFNPTSDRVSSDVVFGFPVSGVTQTNLAEDTVGKKVKLTHGRIRLQLKPKTIQTFRLGT